MTKILTQTWNSTDFTVRVLIESVNMSRERERGGRRGDVGDARSDRGCQRARGTEYDVATQRGIKQAKVCESCL